MNFVLDTLSELRLVSLAAYETVAGIGLRPVLSLLFKSGLEPAASVHEIRIVGAKKTRDFLTWLSIPKSGELGANKSENSLASHLQSLDDSPSNA